MSVIEQAQRARVAAARLAVASRTEKDAALRALADALEARTAEVLAANAEDVAAGRSAGMSDALVDRLTLTEARVRGMAGGLRQVAGLPDPVGEVLRWASSGSCTRPGPT
jgi:glutamate-5-semialdehyde dehydrogenase